MNKQEIEELIDSLGPKVERLKALYEQYFMGIERIPPATLRKDVDRNFWRLRRERINNTGLRFRYQQVLQRYNTYQQYWQRVMRDIERGTYRRSVARAARKFDKEALRAVAGKEGVRAAERQTAQDGSDEAPTPPRGMPVASDIGRLADQATAALMGNSPQKPAAGATRPLPVPRAPGGSDEAAAIHQRLMAAKRANGEGGGNVDVNKLRRSLDRQRQQLQQQHGKDKRIDFEVVDRDGRTMIRPIVRRK